jgi:hypothetical protein
MTAIARFLIQARPKDTPPVKHLLAVTGILEAGTGLGFAVAPDFLARLLLGAPLDSSASLVTGRVLGAALFTIGSACWLARGDIQSRAVTGLIAALLIYNIAAAFLFGYAGLGLRMSGIGVWPAAIVHATLAGWCASCLRNARRH